MRFSLVAASSRNRSIRASGRTAGPASSPAGVSPSVVFVASSSSISARISFSRSCARASPSAALSRVFSSAAIRAALWAGVCRRSALVEATSVEARAGAVPVLSCSTSAASARRRSSSRTTCASRVFSGWSPIAFSSSSICPCSCSRRSGARARFFRRCRPVPFSASPSSTSPSWLRVFHLRPTAPTRPPRCAPAAGRCSRSPASAACGALPAGSDRARLPSRPGTPTRAGRREHGRAPPTSGLG